MPKAVVKNASRKAARSTAPRKSSVQKQKQSTKKPTQQTHSAPGPRRLQAPSAIWYKPLTWRHRPPVPAYRPLPRARLLLWRVLQQFWQQKALFGGITLLYGFLNLVLVRGIAGSSNMGTLKSVLNGLDHGFKGKLIASTGSFVYLLATSGSGSSANSGVYQFLLLLLCSLAFIWVLRQVLAGHPVRVRDGFYLGMYPLVPFILMLLLFAAQLIPLALGGSIFSTITVNGIAVHFWERALWFMLFAVLGVWSLRMVTATLFAFYIVTLPDMTPFKAYKNARRIVYGRRLLLWRKLIFLPVLLFLVALVIEVPLIAFVTPLAPWVLFVLSMAALPVVHGYLYSLYREML